MDSTMFRVLVSLCVALCVIDGLQATSTTDIRFLLDDEAGLRQKLESRVRSLRQRASLLNNTFVPCNCPTSLPVSPPPKRQVAFAGTLSSALTSLTPTTLLNFNSDVVNAGTPYDFRFDHFIGPVDGLYAFSLATYLSAGKYVTMEVMQDGLTIMNTKHGHYDDSRYHRQVSMGTNLVLVNLTQGTEVWPRYVSGSGVLYGDGVPTFSGVLLQEL